MGNILLTWLVTMVYQSSEIHRRFQASQQGG